MPSVRKHPAIEREPLSVGPRGVLSIVMFLFLSALGRTAYGQNDPLVTLTGHTDGIGYVKFSPNGTTLASSSFDGTIKLWNLQTGAVIFTLQGSTSGHVNGIAFSPDGTKLVSTGEDSKVRVWNAMTGTLIYTLSGHSSYTLDVSFSPDGTRFASSGADNSLRIWDANTGSLVKVLSLSTSWATPVRYSPVDGNILAANSSNNVITVWDIGASSVLRNLSGHTSYVVSLSFSPDGTVLASASGDQTIKLWDVSTGNLIATLAGHTAWVEAVSFSPDGHFLASGGFDNVIKIWGANTHTVLGTISGHNDAVFDVDFSPDGRKLASASLDRTIKVWDLSSIIGPPTPTVPSAPSLVTPSEGATVYSGIATTFSWSSVSGATSYEIQFDNDSPADQGNVTSFSLTSSTTGLHTWKVRAKNAAGAGGWSASRSFTVVGVPSAPTLTSPPNGATVYSGVATTFSWSSVSGATSYEIQFDSESPTDQGNVTSFSLTSSTTGSHTWKVRAKNPAGAGGWSATRSFTTVTAPLAVSVDIMPGSSPNTINLKNNGVIPVAILTTSAFNANTVDPLSVRFGPNGAKESHGKGHLEDANGDGLPDMVLHFKTKETGIQSGQAEAGITGKTVQGIDIVGKDAIQIAGGGGRKSMGEAEVEEEAELPTKFSMSQNYPNPFNPSTVISYSLTNTANVSLRIFNTLGQEVSVLVNEQKHPGSYQVVWTANVPSGIYFYRLQTGQIVETKTMILLK